MAEKPAPTGQKPPPKCKAILLCDQIIVDRLTGKTSLIGIFEHFNLQTLPAFTPQVMAFIQLTSGIGKYMLRVEVEDLEQGVTVSRGPEMQIEFPDRLVKLNGIIQLGPVPIAHIGTYDLVVTADGQEIDRQQFRAQLLPPQPKGKDEADDEPKEQ